MNVTSLIVALVLLIAVPSSHPLAAAQKVLAFLCEQPSPFNFDPICNPQQAKCQAFTLENNACINQSIPYVAEDGPLLFTCLRYEPCVRLLEFEGPSCSTFNTIIANTVVPCGVEAPCDESALLQAECFSDHTTTVRQCVALANGTVVPVPVFTPHTSLGTCLANVPFPGSNPPFNASVLLERFEPSCFLVNVSTYFPSNESSCAPAFLGGPPFLLDTQSCLEVRLATNGAPPGYGVRVTCVSEDDAAQYPPLPQHLYGAVRKAVATGGVHTKRRRPAQV